MSRIAKKYIKFGTTSDSLSDLDIPSGLVSPSGYTPEQISSEGTDKISAHLKGISSQLVTINNNLGNSGTSNISESTDNYILESWENTPYLELNKTNFSQDTNTKTDASTTATYSSSTGYYTFQQNNFLLSNNLFSDNFLNNNLYPNSFEIISVWDNSATDTLATYEISRNNDIFYSLLMTQVGNNIFRGNLDLTEDKEYEYLGINDVVTDVYLTSTTTAVGSLILANKNKEYLTKFTVNLKKIGSPLGNYRFKIVKDNSGSPSTSSLDVVVTSPWYSVTDLTTSYSVITQDVSSYNTFLSTELVYWVILEIDSSYITSYTSSDKISVGSNSSVTPYGAAYTSSTWVVDSYVPSLRCYCSFPYKTLVLENSLSSSGSYTYLNTSTIQSLSRKITITDTSQIKSIVMKMGKTGSPSGYFWYELRSDSSGIPSTLLAQTETYLASNVYTGYEIELFLDKILIPGDYHLCIATDSLYKSSYVSGTTQLGVYNQTSSVVSPYTQQYNGTSWTEDTSQALTYNINGYVLDLRLKITGNTNDTNLLGYGVMYNPERTALGSVTLPRQVFTVNLLDNQTTFNITKFTPNPDLIKVYVVENQSCYVHDQGSGLSFTLNGNTLVFPDGHFYNSLGGTLTLIAEHPNSIGDTYNSSNQNSQDLASLFLGRFAQSGRGPSILTNLGTLVELQVNEENDVYTINVVKV